MHGYFKFTETKVGQVSDFASVFGLELEPKDDYYTFSSLVDAPKYSIPGGLYLGAPAIKTFEGEPWEVLRENLLVYDFAHDLVVPKLSITQITDFELAENCFVANGLIMPGAVTDDGSRVTDYAAWFLREKMQFKYTDVIFE